MGSRPARLRSRLVVTALSVALMAAVTAGCNAATSASGSGHVVTLSRISTLRAMFNQADGKARLVLILSPT